MDSGSYSDEKVKGGSEQKREFGCPCGKTYLSYPALFTHVKQKHNGKVMIDSNVGSRQINKT